MCRRQCLWTGLAPPLQAHSQTVFPTPAPLPTGSPVLASAIRTHKHTHTMCLSLYVSLSPLGAIFLPYCCTLSSVERGKRGPNAIIIIFLAWLTNTATAFIQDNITATSEPAPSNTRSVIKIERGWQTCVCAVIPNEIKCSFLRKESSQCAAVGMLRRVKCIALFQILG